MATPLEERMLVLLDAAKAAIHDKDPVKLTALLSVLRTHAELTLLPLYFEKEGYG